MVDLGGGLMHSGLKSSFVTFIPKYLVPIEPVNVTLSRRSIMQLISKYFISKCQVLDSSGRHFCWDKNGRQSVYNLTF